MDIDKGRQWNVSHHLAAMGFTSEKKQQKREHGPGNHQGKACLISVQSVKSDSSNDFSLPFQIQNPAHRRL